jgi:hypothetical protein
MVSLSEPAGRANKDHGSPSPSHSLTLGADPPTKHRKYVDDFTRGRVKQSSDHLANLWVMPSPQPLSPKRPKGARFLERAFG